MVVVEPPEIRAPEHDELRRWSSQGETLLLLDRISNVHNLRTRASGPVIHMQLHADLDPDITLVEAHEIVVAAEERLLAAFPAADILIHPDPHGKAEPHGGHFREGSH